MRRLPALLAVLVLACESPYAPFVSGAELFDPPAVYYQWHREAVECAGVSRSFAAIEWWVVPGVYSYDVPGHGEAGGVWHEPNRIYIAEKKLRSRSLVIHEILHFLLQIAEHPSPPFGVCDVEDDLQELPT